MVNFITPDFEKEKNIVKVGLLRKLDERLPKTKGTLLIQAILRADNKPAMFVGPLCLVAAILLIFKEKSQLAALYLILAIIFLLQLSLSVHKRIKEYKEIKTFLSQDEITYMDCVKFALKYEFSEWTYSATRDFLRDSSLINAMNEIAESQIIDVQVSESTHYITIIYADKNGNVRKYSHQCLLSRNISITEAELKFDCGVLRCTVPYSKAVDRSGINKQ